MGVLTSLLFEGVAGGSSASEPLHATYREIKMLVRILHRTRGNEEGARLRDALFDATRAVAVELRRSGLVTPHTLWREESDRRLKARRHWGLLRRRVATEACVRFWRDAASIGRVVAPPAREVEVADGLFVLDPYQIDDDDS